MIKKIKPVVLSFALFLLIHNGVAQSFELGANAGLVASRFSVSRNFISNDTWVRQGDIDYASRFGIQIGLKGIKDRYNVLNNPLKHGLMIEMSTCRCGGNTEIVSKQLNGSFSVAKLNYITWQTDANLLYRAKFNRTEFIIGPSFSYYTYRGVSNSSRNENEYIFTQRQINKSYFGLELGLGYRFDNLLVSTRYHTNVTAFGEESTVPVEYGHHQFRLVFSYFFYEKRLVHLFKGLYY